MTRKAEDLLVNLVEKSLTRDLILEDGHDRPEPLFRVEHPVNRMPVSLLVEAVASLSQYHVSANRSLAITRNSTHLHAGVRNETWRDPCYAQQLRIVALARFLPAMMLAFVTHDGAGREQDMLQALGGSHSQPMI